MNYKGVSSTLRFNTDINIPDPMVSHTAFPIKIYCHMRYAYMHVPAKCLQPSSLKYDTPFVASSTSSQGAWAMASLNFVLSSSSLALLGLESIAN